MQKAKGLQILYKKKQLNHPFCWLYKMYFYIDYLLHRL
jgi:hypothetical protein